jgi:hypothetical protein
MKPQRRTNRRAAIRRPPRRTTKVVCPSGQWGLGANIAIEVLDISESGIRMRTRAACQPGQEVELTLSSLHTPRPLRLPAEVVWCVQTAEDDFCMGLRFRRPMSFRDSQAL